jgi:hypothetical protein
MFGDDGIVKSWTQMHFVLKLILTSALLQKMIKKNTNTHPKQKNAAAPSPNMVEIYY